ncbi:MAG: tripartite tricarboxylate transporter TctB family protein [Clostridiaceae bacterium]|nr:tripartite tricarboxylate transporter TctB family protein [Clostridiaceae bacterium]
MGELVFLAVVSAAAVIMFIMTFQFPSSILDQSGGAGLFPRIVVVMLLACVLIRLCQYLRKPETRKHFVFLEMFQGLRLVYIVMTGVYIAVMAPLGYIISTVAYMLALINFFYYAQVEHRPSVRSEAVIAVGVVAGTVGMYWFFGSVLHVMLPPGLLKS